MCDSSPVRLVDVEISGPLGVVVLDSKPGDRLWIEVMKLGQIVGVVERSAQGAGLSISVVQELANGYADVEPSPFRSFPDDQLPMATVIIPTIYRRIDELTRTVASVLALDYPNYEVVVVDNRPGTDNPPITEFLGYEKVRVILEPRKGVSSARNRGIAESTGQFIAFTDDDAIVDRNWLRVLGVKFAQDVDVDAIGGMVRPMELDAEAQLWFEEFYGGFTGHYLPDKWSVAIVGDSDPLFPYSAGHFGAGCNMAARRSSFERYGAYDPFLGIGTPTKGGEDLKFFMKVLLGGGTVAFEPAALVRHSHRRTNHEFMVQVFGYGIGLTAMYTSLVFEDHRHVYQMLRRLPRGVKMLLLPTRQRSPSATTDYPRRTQIYQLLGMACGPLLYLRSLASSRPSV